MTVCQLVSFPIAHAIFIYSFTRVNQIKHFSGSLLLTLLCLSKYMAVVMVTTETMSPVCSIGIKASHGAYTLFFIIWGDVPRSQEYIIFIYVFCAV